MGPIAIAVESPPQDDVRMMRTALNRLLLSQSPTEACYHLTAEEMAQPDTTLFVARQNGSAVGIGALRRHADGIGEVKRMYTLPTQQGLGIVGRILAEIEALARKEGYTRLVLETGLKYTHGAAWRVYERAGFSACGPVLDYPVSGYCAFFTKNLTDHALA
jgi:putative acetyltransferase